MWNRRTRRLIEKNYFPVECGAGIHHRCRLLFVKTVVQLRIQFLNQIDLAAGINAFVGQEPTSQDQGSIGRAESVLVDSPESELEFLDDVPWHHSLTGEGTRRLAECPNLVGSAKATISARPPGK